MNRALAGGTCNALPHEVSVLGLEARAKEAQLFSFPKAILEGVVTV